MLSKFFGPKANPIGVDISEDYVKMVQLRCSGQRNELIAGGERQRPEDITFGSSKWQLWVIDSIKDIFSSGGFKGRKAVVSVACSDVFVDHLKKPKCDAEKLNETILAHFKQKLPFDTDDVIVRSVETEQDNLMVFITEHEKINRYLAIYEKDGIQIESMCSWPMAMGNCYRRFFGRRKSDLESIVLLIDIMGKYTNVVISRGAKALFARSILIGSEKMSSDDGIKRFIRELEACRQFFYTSYDKAEIERLIFLSGQTVDRDICTVIAKQMEMAAQMGDCLAAVATTDSGPFVIDRRDCKNSWATAFGLSLS